MQGIIPYCILQHTSLIIVPYIHIHTTPRRVDYCMLGKARITKHSKCQEELSYRSSTGAKCSSLKMAWEESQLSKGCDAWAAPFFPPGGLYLTSAFCVLSLVFISPASCDFLPLGPLKAVLDRAKTIIKSQQLFKQRSISCSHKVLCGARHDGTSL